MLCILFISGTKIRIFFISDTMMTFLIYNSIFLFLKIIRLLPVQWGANSLAEMIPMHRVQHLIRIMPAEGLKTYHLLF